MKIKNLIKTTRIELNESQEVFAKRFNTTGNTVSRWEAGKYEIPNKVIEKILERNMIEVICPKCLGEGMIKKLNLLLKDSKEEV